MTRPAVHSTVPALVASFTLASLVGAVERQRVLAEHRLGVQIRELRVTPTSAPAAVELASLALSHRGALAAWTTAAELLARLDVAAPLREHLRYRRAELELELDALRRSRWRCSEELGAADHWRTALRKRAELLQADAELAAIEARRDELARMEREIDRAFPPAAAEECPLEYELPPPSNREVEAELERDEGREDERDANAPAFVVHGIAAHVRTFDASGRSPVRTLCDRLSSGSVTRSREHITCADCLRHTEGL